MSAVNHQEAAGRLIFTALNLQIKKQGSRTDANANASKCGPNMQLVFGH